MCIIIPEVLKYYLHKRHMSRREFIRKARLSELEVYCLESQVQLSSFCEARICDALQCRLDDLCLPLSDEERREWHARRKKVQDEEAIGV